VGGTIRRVGRRRGSAMRQGCGVSVRARFLMIMLMPYPSMLGVLQLNGLLGICS
jgi:hypothetical protein